MYIIPIFLSVIYLFCVFVFRIEVAQHTVIVVSPLKLLMHDQVKRLRNMGIKAVAVTSDTPDAETNGNLGFKYPFLWWGLHTALYLYLLNVSQTHFLFPKEQV